MSTPKAIAEELEQLEALATPTTEEVTPEPETQETQETQEVQDTQGDGELYKLRNDNTRLEQANKTLQGKYDAEVPRLHKTVDAMRRQIADLVETIKRQQESAPASKAHSADDFDLDEEQKGYGDALWDGVAKIVRKEVSRLESKLEGVRTMVDETSEAKFFEKLDGLLPEWESVDRSEAFQTWARKHDEIIGMTYRSRLMDAHQRGDAKGAAAVYRKFVEETRPKNKLESQVVPPTTGSGSQGVQRKAQDATMTFAEWEREMQRLTASNLPPVEMERKLNELTELARSGKVK